jgi:hypothetical protein
MADKKIIRGDGTELPIAGYQFTAEKLIGHKPYSSSKQITTLPPKVDLRSFLTSVENQQQTSSCVANAVAGAYEYLVKQHLKDKSYDVSRLFIYYNARYLGNIEGDNGSYIADAIKGLKEYGACSETTWPFDESLVNDEPNQQAYDEAVNFLIEDTQLVQTNLNDWKMCLAEGYPVIFAIKLFDSFDKQRKKGLVPLPTSSEKNRESHSGHSMLCVGYSEADKLFIVRNSWGDSWGDSGYCYIPYDYLMNKDYNFGDSWIIRRLENVDFDETDWGDETSIVGDFNHEFAKMTDEEHSALIDAVGDYPLELRLAILYLQVAGADANLSDDEQNEIVGHLQEIINSLGVNTSVEKLVKRAADYLEDQQLLEDSIDLLGSYLSNTMLASIIKSLTAISGSDEISSDEQSFLDILVQRWQVDTELSSDETQNTEESEEEESADDYDWYKVIEKTKLYSEADTNSDIVVKLSEGDEVAFSEEVDDDWSYVFTDDNEGYILNSTVDWGSDEEETEAGSEDDDYDWYKVIENAKMYAEADENSEVITKLSVGDDVAYAEEVDDDWSYMKTYEFEGYVLNSCIDWESE